MCTSSDIVHKENSRDYRRCKFVPRMHNSIMGINILILHLWKMLWNFALIPMTRSTNSLCAVPHYYNKSSLKSSKVRYSINCHNLSLLWQNILLMAIAALVIRTNFWCLYPPIVKTFSIYFAQNNTQTWSLVVREHLYGFSM